jgi:protocatechuate 3,4-dioxygenase, beta subunit
MGKKNAVDSSNIGHSSLTPHLILGPFFPIEKPDGVGSNLLKDWGQEASRHGQLVELAGRVIDLRGRPVVGAIVEIWQANARGRYRHPGDLNEAPLDPQFLGYGAQRTDAKGRYRFTTVKPGAYRHRDQLRAPHIHFQVTGKTDRLITQMFFLNEPLNTSDWLLNGSPRPEMLLAPLLPEADVATGSVRQVLWDIVLMQG